MIRGGTSRGIYLLKDDLPQILAERDAVLVRALGGPDPLQVDGVGGGHPLTSKVAIVSPSVEPDVDVDYLFLQVDPVQQTVSDVQNCGNILAGVGLFAIDQGLLETLDGVTIVRVRMLNTGALCHLEVRTPDRAIQVEGDTAIDGVPGTSAPIICNYRDIAGSACGALLPTGNAVDTVDGVRATCVDNGMPVIAMRARDLGIVGTETPVELDADDDLKARLESIRVKLGPAMNLGDVTHKSVPKLCLVSAAQNGGLINTRTFIPHACHKTIGVLGAVSAATACLLPESHLSSLANVPDGNPKIVDVEHPQGSLRVQLALDESGSIVRAGVVRTGRILFKGEIYV